MKKSTYLFAIALGVSTISLAQNVGINTDGSDPDTDALLHLLNTNSTALDPLIRLENQQNASVNGIELLNSGGATAAEWDLYIPSSSTDFRVSNGTTDHVTIQNDGDVGIGTSTPTVPLDIEATNAAIDINNTSTDPLIHFQVSGTTNFTIGTDVTDSKFKIGTTALETGTAITVQPTGEVGIGTTAPGARLEVDGEGTADGGQVFTIVSDGDRELRVLNPIDGDITSPWQFWTADAYEFIVEEPAGGLSTLNIEADADVRIESDNNANMLFVDYSADAVGIGTSSPGAELDVNGNMYLSASSTEARSINLGLGRSGNGSSFIDLIGDATYTDYGLRIVRTNSGANSSSKVVHRGTGELLFEALEAADINFKTNSTNRMRIKSTGEVGIGTSSPNNLLTIGSVATSGQDGIMIEDPSATTYGAYFHYDDANTEVKIGGVTAGSYNSTIVIPRDNNRVGIGRTPATNALEVNGDASKTSSGDWLANSDARLKKEIKQMDSQEILNKMLQLNGVTYLWSDTITGNDRPTQLQYGFTAQNIQEVFPLLVQEDALGYLQTAYGTYDAMYVESMRALQQQINKQQAIIEAQKKENESLKAEASNATSSSKENSTKIAELEAKLNALLLNQNVTLSAKNKW